MNPAGSALTSSSTTSVLIKPGIEPCTFEPWPGMTEDALDMVSQYTIFPDFAETATSPGSPFAAFAVKAASGRGSPGEGGGKGSLNAMTSRADGVEALEL